jgi:hypothetical protein
MPTVSVGRIAERGAKNGFARELAMMAASVISSWIFPTAVKLEHLDERVKTSFLWIYPSERITSEVKVSSGTVLGRPRVIIVDSGGRLIVDGAFAVY